MKRRILSIVMALVLCLGLLPGTARADGEITTRLDFTNVGADDGQTPAAGEGYTWDETTKTLTLNGLNLSIASDAAVPNGKGAITLPEGSTLVIEGTSNISVERTSLACVMYSGALTVRGTGTLNINLNASYSKAIYCTKANWPTASIRLESGTLNITAPQTAVRPVGISSGAVTLCGADVTATNLIYGIGNDDYLGAETVTVSAGSLTINSQNTEAGTGTGIGICLPISPASTTSTLSITGGTVDISGIQTAINFGKGTVTVSGGTLGIHDMLTNSRGYSWAFDGRASGAAPQLNLLSDNISISGCVENFSIAGASVNAFQINSSVGLSGLLTAYINNNENTVNQNEVRVYGDYTLPESRIFAGNQNGVWVIDMTPGSKLTIPAGFTLDMSALNREYANLTEGINKDTVDLSAGTVINNGTLKFPDTVTKEQAAEWDISGSGTVTIGNDTTLYCVTVIGGTADKSCAEAGDTVTLTAGDDPAKRFTGWTAAPGVDISDNSFTMPAQAVTVTEEYETLNTVTFDSQGGTAVENQYMDSGAAVTKPADPTRSGYTFGGWYKEAACENAWDFDTDTVTENITLYAKWTDNTSGSGGSGNSSGNSSGGGSVAPSLPVSTTGQNNSAVTTTTTAAPAADSRGGTASSTVSSAVGSEIVKQAVENNSESVVIAPEITGDVTSTKISIPASTVGGIGSKTNASLTVSTPVADVTIPNGALGSLSAAGGTVTVAAEEKDGGVELTVTAGGRTVESIPGGVTLTVPVSGAAPGTVAVLVHEDGTRQVVRKSVAGDGSVTVPLDGSAKLEIVDNSRQFSDVPAGSWAADAVAFASAHELFAGTGEGRFSPDLPMSRGMLAVVLYNLENSPEQALTGVFADVSNGAWYAAGVAWAAENGIVSGYGNGLFGPDDSITREQLAVMLWRYAGSPAAGEELSFTDADSISAYALEAMRWAVENGIMSGFGNGLLCPLGQATRAQAAQMLKNYMSKQLLTKTPHPPC